MTFTLLAPKGYELLRLKSQSINEEMGASALGRCVIKYLSGWVYVHPEFTVTRDGRKLSVPFAPLPGADYILTRGDVYAALCVRNSYGETFLASIEGMESFSIGRDHENTIVYKDGLVSSCHCRVSVNARGEVMYTDLSVNGSYVNGKRLLGGRETLSPGSRVLVPPLLELMFEDGYIRFNAPDRLERVRLERLEQPPRAASEKEESK